MNKVLPTAILLAFLISCTSGPLSLLTGGGPNVAANVQAGAENTQQVVANQTSTQAGRDIISTSKQVDVKEVDQISINNESTDYFVWLFALLGWVLPSPNQIGSSVRSWFSSLKN